MYVCCALQSCYIDHAIEVVFGMCCRCLSCSKNNAAIVTHMEAEGIDFLQFAFRWVNCLLIREVPFGAALRLWDTYLAEGPRFNEFLVGGTSGLCCAVWCAVCALVLQSVLRAC